MEENNKTDIELLEEKIHARRQRAARMMLVYIIVFLIISIIVYISCL